MIHFGLLVRRTVRDSFLRNSALLILNYAIVGVIGFAFWAVAARSFDAAEIGNVAALFSGLTFVSVAAGLGFQLTIVRYLASEPNQRALVVATTALIGATGTLGTLVVVLVPGHFGLPIVGQDGILGDLLIVLVGLLLTTGAVTDAVMIGLRAAGTIVVKNAVAGLLRIGLLSVFVGAGETGLLLCLLISIAVSTMTSFVVGLVRSHQRERQPRPFRTLRGKLQFSAGNYVAMLLSIGPLSILPVYVVNVLGPARGAYYTVCVLLVAALSAVPSTISQSLFAELAANTHGQLRLSKRAFRIAYSLMTPIVVLLVALAPIILRIFGLEYAEATYCLQFMAVGSLFGCFNYIADVLLNAAGRIGLFTIVNVLGAVAVIASAMTLGRYGLTWLGFGWLIGQVIYSIFAAAGLLRSGLMSTLTRPATA